MIPVHYLVKVLVRDELGLSLMAHLLVSLRGRFEHGIEDSSEAFGYRWVVVRGGLLTRMLRAAGVALVKNSWSLKSFYYGSLMGHILESIVLQGVLGKGAAFNEVLCTLMSDVRVVGGWLKPP